MLLSSILTFGLAASTASAWTMTSYKGNACALSSDHRVYNQNLQSGRKCIRLPAGTKSIKVTKTGPCTTTYYHDNNCGTASFLANRGICNGFNGGRVGSVAVTC